MPTALFKTLIATRLRNAMFMAFAFLLLLCAFFLNRFSEPAALWAGLFQAEESFDSDTVVEGATGEPLIVLTRNSATTFYEGPQGEAMGFEYDLVKRFAAYLKRPVEFRVRASDEQILKELAEGAAHFAAAGLSVTRSIPEGFTFSPSYLESPLVLVCRNFFKLADFNSFDQELMVSKGSAVEELLSQKFAQNLKYRAIGKSAEDLLSEVAAGLYDCTMTDRHVMSLHTRYLKSLNVIYEWKETDKRAWVFAPANKALRDASERWFGAIQKNGTLYSLIDRYFGHDDSFDSFDIGRFMRRIKTRLPKYVKYFEEAAEETQFSAQLLAALSYQESHWDARAKSPTGVRGLMMLTLETASRVGVTNRLDPAESVLGGARYLRMLKETLPDYLKDEDRLWMALAAYNVGFGHLQDARALTLWRGKNPNLWSEVAEILPLLSNEAYLPYLRHGVARGYEPVEFVGRVRNYLNILESDESVAAIFKKRERSELWSLRDGLPAETGKAQGF